jgi:hypothetical protein
MIKVSYGMGVDSTAMLIGMHQRGIRPDAILFADTGGEKPDTYAYLPIMQAWLRSVGWPEVVVVRYEPKRAPYSTLEGKCLANETLPSLAFGMKSCSLVFKTEVQNKWLRSNEIAQACWARGEKVTVCIGYDAGPKDARRSKIADDTEFTYSYLLREWGWDREECERQIIAAGMPLPPKSACWFCPASKKHEVIWLRDNHPDLYQRAVDMERLASTGKHGLKSTKGLGRTWAWASLEVPA